MPSSKETIQKNIDRLEESYVTLLDMLDKSAYNAIEETQFLRGELLGVERALHNLRGVLAL